MQRYTTMPVNYFCLLAEIRFHTLNDSNLVTTVPPIQSALKLHTLTTYHLKIHHPDTSPSPQGKIKNPTYGN